MTSLLLVRSPIRLFFKFAGQWMFVRTIDIHQPQPATLAVVVHKHKLRPVGRPLRMKRELHGALRRQRAIVCEIHWMATIRICDEDVRLAAWVWINTNRVRDPATVR